MTLELTNQRFGRLIVIEKSIYRTKNRCFKWKCLCDCGQIKYIDGSSLKNGNTKSCGCLAKEINSKLHKGRQVHNAYKDKTQSSFNFLFYRYKQSALKRNIKFDLTKEQFKIFTQQNCFYCNKSPGQISRNVDAVGHYKYNGIDRKDNNIGYIINNCVPCCKICNRAKDILTIHQFFDHIKQIYLYSKL